MLKVLSFIIGLLKYYNFLVFNRGVGLVLGVAVLLGAIALAISIPVRRAIKIDPVGSLRAE